MKKMSAGEIKINGNLDMHCDFTIIAFSGCVGDNKHSWNSYNHPE
ncbi:MAG TPA: hypothetical protein VGK06_00830 [Methanosarcina sp.]